MCVRVYVCVHVHACVCVVMCVIMCVSVCVHSCVCVVMCVSVCVCVLIDNDLSQGHWKENLKSHMLNVLPGIRSRIMSPPNSHVDVLDNIFKRVIGIQWVWAW